MMIINTAIDDFEPIIKSGRRNGAAITVVVPLAPGETAGGDLVRDLAGLWSDPMELVVATTDPESPLLARIAGQFEGRMRQIVTAPGRAGQMNGGARAASGVYLWFLHADSHLPPGAVEALRQAIEIAPGALHFFGLRFHDGPVALRLNSFGAEFRSRCLGIPFGDQGFCIRRDLFFDLGGFDESVAFGEDHRFVWTARRHGLRVRRVAGALSTSGRKYAEYGWARTTLGHLGLTVRQAVPELMRFWSEPR